MRKLMVLALVFLSACGTAPNGDPVYTARLGREWHPMAVRADQVSLASGADTVNCHVKAYGWKLLDKQRVKTIRDAWFQRGRPRQKWGWKMFVQNAGDAPFIVHIGVTLVTDEDMQLGSSGYGMLAYLERLGDEIGSVSLGRVTPKNLVRPGETRLFSGTAWYWLDEHSREGHPARVRWSIEHLYEAPGSQPVHQRMAIEELQPSN